MENLFNIDRTQGTWSHNAAISYRMNEPSTENDTIQRRIFNATVASHF